MSRLPGGAYTTLGRTGRRVSRLGFGCYRVDDRVPQHREALELALRSGVNVIDTSTNYADGHSESLVGEVLSSRGGGDDLVVVTKAGYVQGANLREAKTRASAGRPWPEMTHYDADCWHCVAPAFLGDQLTASLERLRLPRVDVLLLHNPEYFLMDAEHRGTPREEARAVFYERLGRAFAHLEQEADRGRLSWYGVSSNTLAAPHRKPDATDLERMLAIAGPRFAVVQLPMNALELGAREPIHTAAGRSVLEVAGEAGLGVLVNRPLNAFGPEGLSRLAEARRPFEPVEAPRADALERLSALEKEFLERFAPRLALPEGASAEELIALSPFLAEMGRRSLSSAALNELWESWVAPRLEDLFPELARVFEGDTGYAAWSARHLATLREAATLVTARATDVDARREKTLARKLKSAFGDVGEGTLSQRALRGLAATPGVDVVLLGMRRPEYVKDAVAAFS